MNNVIKILQKEKNEINLDNFIEKINDTFDNLLKHDIPTIGFIKKEELDDYRVISRQKRKEVIVDEQKATLYIFNVEILTFRIIVYKGEYFQKNDVEIYFEDDLVFKAKGEYEWKSFEEFGIDDGTDIWQFEKPDFFIEGEWQRYFMIIHLCQEEENAAYRRESEIEEEKENESFKSKLYSDLKIKEDT